MRILLVISVVLMIVAPDARATIIYLGVDDNYGGAAPGDNAPLSAPLPPDPDLDHFNESFSGVGYSDSFTFAPPLFDVNLVSEAFFEIDVASLHAVEEVFDITVNSIVLAGVYDLSSSIFPLNQGDLERERIRVNLVLSAPLLAAIAAGSVSLQVNLTDTSIIFDDPGDRTGAVSYYAFGFVPEPSTAMMFSVGLLVLAAPRGKGTRETRLSGRSH